MSDLSRTIHNPPTTDDARAIASAIANDATASALLPGYSTPSELDAVGVMRVKDLGTVTVAELFANGAKTLYTPAEDELVLGLFRSGVDIGDVNWDLTIEPLANGGSVFWNSPTNLSTSLSDLPNTVPISKIFPNAPVVAVMAAIIVGGPEIHKPAGVWQANHVYALNDAIIDGAGHLQAVTTAGTSDNSIPTFDDASGTTADNTVTWSDCGIPPTTGSARVAAIVGKMTAP